MNSFINKRDEEFYNKFAGKTIESIKQIDNEKLAVKFTDGTAFCIYNKGIPHEDNHITIYEL